MWFEGNISSVETIYGINNNAPYSLFVTSSGDIYVDNGYYNGQVDKWTINATNSIAAMYITQSCQGLFVDINNTLYCSLTNLNQIVTKSLDDASNTVRIIAGTGCCGSTSNMLCYPEGIFVDINFNLYVADTPNQRIQVFQSGQTSATTVAGSTAPGTITLNSPSYVVLDADGYLFIVDSGNHRIIGSGPAGFRCVVGCSGTLGSASNQLYSPHAMAFDSYGNIFVADTDNSRIQKFVLNADSCGMYHYILQKEYI
jgi:sugar lactone lactonase YvrE